MAGRRAAAEEVDDRTYVVRHAAVNVWDPTYDLKEAKKERIVRRLRKGEEVTAEDLKHADVERLLATRAIIVKSDEDAEEQAAAAPEEQGEFSEVPESEGSKTPDQS